MKRWTNPFGKISNFRPKPWTNPFAKMPILWVFHTEDFFCSERLVCYIKRRKSFFHDLFSRSMTWEYRGLQGVTRGYMGLQGVTRGDRGRQGVTVGYKGL